MPETASKNDKLIACVDCGAQFVFSARDQAFYQERGYQEPRRCKACRSKRKTTSVPVGKPAPGAHAEDGVKPEISGAEAAGLPPPPQFKVTCSACGAEATVPFKPDPSRPVYCRTCFVAKRSAGGSPKQG